MGRGSATFGAAISSWFCYYEVMDGLTLEKFFNRKADANKYDFGHVLVIGGSPGMVGAPFLAAKAALRAGAGLVTIASHADVIDKLEKRVEEIMTLRLPADEADALSVIQSFVHERKVSAVVIGPGQSPDWRHFDQQLLAQLSVPVVVDGGALGAFQNDLDELKKRGTKNSGIVLTPHGGEYERLRKVTLPRDPTALARDAAAFARGMHVTLVLKGHATVVAQRNGGLYRNTTGNPGMATAGSGDVLSGIIGGLLAQGLAVKDATESGVYLHGLAGDIAAAQSTQPGMIASDLIEYLPQALAYVQRHLPESP